jgi:hypothetical protein
MSKAIELIAQRLGESVARRACGENPWRVLLGRPLEQPPRKASDESDPLAELMI